MLLFFVYFVAHMELWIPQSETNKFISKKSNKRFVKKYASIF